MVKQLGLIIKVGDGSVRVQMITCGKWQTWYLHRRYFIGIVVGCWKTTKSFIARFGRQNFRSCQSKVILVESVLLWSRRLSNLLYLAKDWPTMECWPSPAMPMAMVSNSKAFLFDIFVILQVRPMTLSNFHAAIVIPYYIDSKITPKSMSSKFMQFLNYQVVVSLFSLLLVSCSPLQMLRLYFRRWQSQQKIALSMISTAFFGKAL
jgi:hypothetical protein